MTATTAKAQKSQPPVTDLETILKTVMNRLDAIASQNPPDWRLPFSYYKAPWWLKIGATVLSSDGHGPSQVMWAGHTYTRRTGSAKFGAAIWFSRSVGTSENGTEYGRLITFKDVDAAEPLPDYIVTALSKATVQQTETPTR